GGAWCGERGPGRGRVGRSRRAASPPGGPPRARGCRGRRGRRREDRGWGGDTGTWDPPWFVGDASGAGVGTGVYGGVDTGRGGSITLPPFRGAIKLGREIGRAHV